MKSIVNIVFWLCFPILISAQSIKSPKAPFNKEQKGFNEKVVLKNETKQPIVFLIGTKSVSKKPNPSSDNDQNHLMKDLDWENYKLEPNQSVDIPVTNGKPVISIKTGKERPYIYSLQPGSSYSIFWSNPRSVFDVALKKY